MPAMNVRVNPETGKRTLIFVKLEQIEPGLYRLRDARTDQVLLFIDDPNIDEFIQQWKAIKESEIQQ
jgi:hypothetical protein